MIRLLQPVEKPAHVTAIFQINGIYAFCVLDNCNLDLFIIKFLTRNSLFQYNTPFMLWLLLFGLKNKYFYNLCRQNTFRFLKASYFARKAPYW